MTTKRYLVLTGDVVEEVESARGGFVRIFSEAMGTDLTPIDARTDALEVEPGAPVVITGSAANLPNREPWMLRTEAALRDLVARGHPVLGVCFGHQLLAEALGGDVRANPRGREMSTVTVQKVADDPLLEGLEERFAANACHSDTVTRPPAGAAVLARNEADPYQALRFGPRCYGVQFHPEFDGQIMKSYVRARREALIDEQLDPEALEARALDTPEALRVFENFRRMCG